MDRDRDRDRGGSSSSSRQLKRTKLSSSSSESGRHSSQHSSRDSRESRDKEKEPKLTEHKSQEEDKEKDKPTAINKKDLYEAVTAYELEEAKRLDCDKTLERFLQILADVEENVVDVLAIKYGEETATPEQKAFLKIDAMTSLATLRNLNRLLKIKLKIAKDEQQECRQQVDSEHLTLQNLLYEATHLQNQVAAVQDYKGMDEKIDLISVDQFYKEAPPNVSKEELTKEDPHLLRIARLEYEFIQRQKLTEECTALEKEKEAIGKNIEEKQTKLDGVRPLLNKLLESTLPLQDFFDLDISAKKSRLEIARFLPQPLYVLFIQSEAYQESVCGKQNFTIHIRGDVEAAKELSVSEEKDDDDSDEEKNADPETDVTARHLKRKRSSFGFTVDEGRKRTLQKHPLWIEWNITSKTGEKITIQFNYLVKLKIVTVKSNIHRDSSDGTSSTSIAGNSDNVLCELFPNDFGLESPNPANAYLLRKFGISSINEYVKETGKPYRWAQNVCGLDFPKESDGGGVEVKASMDISCQTIDDIYKSIRKRLSNQGKLWVQLKSLESRNFQIPTPAKELLPQNNSTNFTSWEEISFEDYCKQAFTRSSVESGAVSAKDMFFKAVFQRGQAKMIALISIKNDFPIATPIFCIQLDMDGEFRDAETDASIRDIEKEVNVYAPMEFAEWADTIVSIQLYRLMSCCDVVLETDPMLRESSGPSEFSRLKLLLRTTLGRNLRRPFQYVNQGGGHFTQRY